MVIGFYKWGAPLKVDSKLRNTLGTRKMPFVATGGHIKSKQGWQSLKGWLGSYTQKFLKKALTILEGKIKEKEVKEARG